MLVAMYARGRGYLSAVTEYIYVWEASAGSAGDPWIGRAEVGWALPAHLVLSAGYDAPLAGEERFENRGRLSLAWQLGHAANAERCDPTCICHLTTTLDRAGLGRPESSLCLVPSLTSPLLRQDAPPFHRS